jgi:hypothetical protein
MKKILTAILALIATPSIAQLNGDGFYRIQNNASERYLTLKDDIQGEVDYSAGNVDLSNLRTWRGFDLVKSNPASVFYVKKISGTQYDMAAQGTSIFQITGGKKYLDIYDEGGIYLFEGSGNGISANLYDSNNSSERGYVSIKKSASGYQYWRFVPITTDGEYLGLQPTVHANDGWYGTVYASYPFKLASSNVKVYYVDGVHQGQFELMEITDEIKPAATPLLFMSDSNDPAQNKIIPVNEVTSKPEGNLLGGTYFANSIDGHIARVEFKESTMRVLGVDAENNLIFTTAKASDLTDSKYINMNTCWLNIPEGLTGDFKLVDRGTYTGISNIETSLPKTAQKGTYTLTGVQVDDTKALRPGVYIKDGKKIVMK